MQPINKQLIPVITNDITKAELKGAVLNTVETLKDTGGVLDLADLVTKIDFYIKELKANKEFIELTRDEVMKYGKDILLSSGTKIELAETGVKYDYSQCNDTKLQQLELQIADLEEKVEMRKKLLKALPICGEEIHAGDGELYVIYPPSKSSTSSFKTTLPK